MCIYMYTHTHKYFLIKTCILVVCLQWHTITWQLRHLACKINCFYNNPGIILNYFFFFNFSPMPLNLLLFIVKYYSPPLCSVLSHVPFCPRLKPKISSVTFLWTVFKLSYAQIRDWLGFFSGGVGCPQVVKYRHVSIPILLQASSVTKARISATTSKQPPRKSPRQTSRQLRRCQTPFRWGTRFPGETLAPLQPQKARFATVLPSPAPAVADIQRSARIPDRSPALPQLPAAVLASEKEPAPTTRQEPGRAPPFGNMHPRLGDPGRGEGKQEVPLPAMEILKLYFTFLSRSSEPRHTSARGSAARAQAAGPAGRPPGCHGGSQPSGGAAHGAAGESRQPLHRQEAPSAAAAEVVKTRATARSAPVRAGGPGGGGDVSRTSTRQRREPSPQPGTRPQRRLRPPGLPLALPPTAPAPLPPRPPLRQAPHAPAPRVPSPQPQPFPPGQAAASPPARRLLAVYPSAPPPLLPARPRHGRQLPWHHLPVPPRERSPPSAAASPGLRHRGPGLEGERRPPLRDLAPAGEAPASATLKRATPRGRKNTENRTHSRPGILLHREGRRVIGGGGGEEVPIIFESP